MISEAAYIQNRHIRFWGKFGKLPLVVFYCQYEVLDEEDVGMRRFLCGFLFFLHKLKHKSHFSGLGSLLASYSRILLL